MCFKAFRIIGIAREIGAIGVTFLEQHMHDRAGERAVGARQRREMQIGDFSRRGAVGVNDDEPSAALAPRLRDIGHHVDLG